MTSILSDAHAGLSDETIQVILPTPVRTFEKRAARWRFLAPNNAIGAYLEAVARLADAQVATSQALPLWSGLSPMPKLPLNVHDFCYEGTWQKALGVIVSEMQLTPLPEPSQNALSRLNTADAAGLESLAHAVLNGDQKLIDLAASPFIAAALQVYWTGMAFRVHALFTEQSTYRCPVCASPPVAGIVLGGRKVRYLCCSLCTTSWYVPRLTCTNCGSTAGLSYFTVDGDANGTKAEACSQCNTYLKLFYLESNPEAEALADDLATLPLDLLMADRGYSRSGVNLFLLQEQPR